MLQNEPFEHRGIDMTDWTKVSSAAEILSSVAILVTLMFLAFEIQQNSEATQAGTRQAMLESDQQFLEQIVENPDLHLLWYKRELSDEEKVRLSYFLISHFRMRENNWLQYQNGQLDRATWESYSQSILAVLSAPRTRTWWNNFGVDRLFDPRFISVVNQMVENGPIYDQSPHLLVFD